MQINIFLISQKISHRPNYCTYCTYPYKHTVKKLDYSWGTMTTTTYYTQFK